MPGKHGINNYELENGVEMQYNVTNEKTKQDL